MMTPPPEPSRLGSDAKTVVIKNLDKSIDNKALLETFSPYGKVVSCNVICDKNGPRGHGFVQFETEESAQSAIERVHGTELAGKKVHVSKFKPQEERNSEYTNLYVKNFGEEIDDNGLQAMFERFGQIVSVKVMTDDRGRSKCFGFVNFEEPDSAEKAVQGLHGSVMNGRQIYVGRAQSKAERKVELEGKYGKCNLYIKHLDDSLDDDQLRQVFEEFGAITSAKVMKHPNGRSKGFGFVCYKNPDAATEAVKKMNGRIVAGKPLYVCYGQRREERIAQLSAQYAQGSSLNQPQPEPMPPAASTTSVYQSTVTHPVVTNPSQVYAPPMGASNYLPVTGTVPTQPPVASTPPQASFALPAQLGQGHPQAATVWQGQLPTPSGPALATGMQSVPTRMTYPATQPAFMVQPGVSGPMDPSTINRYGFSYAAPFPDGTIRQPYAVENQMPQQAPVVIGSPEQMTPTMVTASTHYNPKQLLGERLFALVKQIYPELASLITSILLRRDVPELMNMLKYPEFLKAKTDEVARALNPRPLQQPQQFQHH